MPWTYEAIARRIDHSLLGPTLTDADLEAGCRLAAEYQVASVCVKPYAVALARRILDGSGVAVGTNWSGAWVGVIAGAVTWVGSLAGAG